MNWIEDVAYRQIIAALIAASFYVVTYFSFIRLLRYWRNWYPPTRSSSLMTAGLALVTVAYISISPQGLSLLALALAAGFIACLFGIIAAPAIAFEPGAPRPVVEFLAKHGEYAGLWMIPPAIIAGYVLPDARLLGLLVAAVAIELAWFLRRRGAARRSYPIDARDLLVLQTQAVGNVAKFAKQHTIRELEISSDGGVSWLGCTKTSLPCPLNHYIHRLGLNTPPCCREHIAELGHFVTGCLRDMGAIHWIDGGTLLGAVREDGALLAWEDDIDISILIDGDTTWETLCTTISRRGAEDGYYIDIFEDSSYLTVSYDRPQSWPFRWERNRMRGEIRLDLVIYRLATDSGQPVLERQLLKGAMPVMQSGWHGVPKEIVLPTSTINFLGSDVPCPNQPEAFLEILYGDFRTVELTYVDKDAAKLRADLGLENNT